MAKDRHLPETIRMGSNCGQGWDEAVYVRDDIVLAACKAALPFLLAADSGMCLDADAEIEIVRAAIARAEGLIPP